MPLARMQRREAGNYIQDKWILYTQLFGEYKIIHIFLDISSITINNMSF